MQGFRAAIDAHVYAETKRVAAQILARLHDTVSAHLDAAREAIESAEQLAAQVETRESENRPQSGVVVADSAAAIDVTTPEFYEQFYNKHRIANPDLRAALAERLHLGPASCLRQVARSRQAKRELFELVATHLVAQRSDVNIVDLLDGQLGSEDDHVREAATARVEEVLAACRPLWQADIGQADCRFADTVILGAHSSV